MMLLSSFLPNWNVWTFLFVNILVIVNADDLKLKLVQLLFRHGDRSPTKSYPTDPWKNSWPDGFGQLTTLGMLQQYRMGQYLRERYGNLINETYNQRTVFVRSTNVDRTLMSAYANLAGFIPPEGRHVWNKNLTWQPIPVHTLPEHEDYLLSLNSKCPKYDKLFQEEMESPEAKRVDSKFKDFYKFLADKTGLSINNFNQASEIYDILYIEQIHNLIQPDWVHNDVMDKLELIHLFKAMLRVKTHELRKLRGGVLVGEMVKNMGNVIQKEKDQHKIYIYSAHDVTVVSLLSALGVFEAQAPPYCSMVMLELLERNGSYFVKILYRNDTTREPYELSLKGCKSPCPYEDFKQLTASIIPKDIKAECEINDGNIAFISAIAGSVLGCMLLVLIVSAYVFYKRNTANYQYLNIQDDI